MILATLLSTYGTGHPCMHTNAVSAFTPRIRHHQSLRLMSLFIFPSHLHKETQLINCLKLA